MKKWMKVWIGMVLAGSLVVANLTGCGSRTSLETSNTKEADDVTDAALEDRAAEKTDCIKQVSSRPVIVPDKEDKYRTFYEVFVYSYCDSNADGIGDLKGLIGHLIHGFSRLANI